MAWPNAPRDIQERPTCYNKRNKSTKKKYATATFWQKKTSLLWLGFNLPSWHSWPHMQWTTGNSAQIIQSNKLRAVCHDSKQSEGHGLYYGLLPSEKNLWITSDPIWKWHKTTQIFKPRNFEVKLYYFIICTWVGRGKFTWNWRDDPMGTEIYRGSNVERILSRDGEGMFGNNTVSIHFNVKLIELFKKKQIQMTRATRWTEWTGVFSGLVSSATSLLCPKFYQNLPEFVFHDMRRCYKKMLSWAGLRWQSTLKSHDMWTLKP